ncbi:hypothetical protein ACM66B_000170 [Microbotryomycetes sp. NB124-2]
MASSLAAECNRDKHEYDTCFNHWFKSYLLLVSPPLANPIDTPQGQKEKQQRSEAIARKRQEYETQCGDMYRQYQNCLKRGIQEKDGLAEMLESARREEPLDGWGGIRVATKDDLKQQPAS